MPWHEPRLTGASGKATVREGQGKLTRAENFCQRGAATAANELTSMKRYCLQARQAASWCPHQRWRAGNSYVRQRQRYSFPAIYRRRCNRFLAGGRVTGCLLRDRRSKERRAGCVSPKDSRPERQSIKRLALPVAIAFNAGNLSQWQQRCATNSRTFS
jgi:hypothetical protein